MFCRLASLAAVLAVLAGCGPVSTGGAPANILMFGNGAEPQDLDPHVVTGVPEHRILTALFEGLVNLDPETLEPVPGVAEAWEESADGLSYTFRLRANARWSNGDPVTAEDFLYAWERILDPTMASEYASMLYCLENARAFNEGSVTDFGLVGAKAPDDRTIRVNLAHPTPWFLPMQVHYTWFPVHRATLEKFGAARTRGTPWTRPGNFVGNGAFRLERWEPDRVLEVSPNPHYWGRPELPRLAGVHFYPVDNLQTEELLFRVGRLHLTQAIPLTKFDPYAANRPEVLRNDPYLGSYYYRLNVTRPPLDDRRVRRALALAVDREDLVGNVVRMGRTPAASLCPPGIGGYTSRSGQPFDPEEARRLLAEAGYPGGRGFPEIEILYNTSEAHRQIAEAVQSMWREHLDIRATLHNQEWKVYLNSMDQLDYAAARSAWIADYPDAFSFLECFTTGNGNNRTGYASPEYDALLARALAEPDEAARGELMQQAEALLLEDAPIIPIYFYTNAFLKAESVGGLPSNALGYFAFREVTLEGDGT
jgi:oligopeptide transport system substrate-binding protein